ncbi:MAG: molybdopterin biosynthesis protein [Nitrospinota bacterium]|nr:molybdopterin biosynthesis protein [Nitrospinota bacterium]
MSDSLLPLTGRKYYLENVPREKALEKLYEDIGKVQKFSFETISVQDSFGRVTHDPIYALISSPHFHAAAMDGYGIEAKKTFGVSTVNPKSYKINLDVFPLDTGDPLPEDTDSVVIIENVNQIREGEIQLESSISPWQNVRVAGEDIVEGQLIFPAGHQLSAVDLGALLAAGVLNIVVRKCLEVAIIPTGDELVYPGTDLKDGELLEFNSVVMSNLIRDWGAVPTVFPILKDNFEEIERVVGDAVENFDVVLVNAGSSAGKEDFTSSIVEKLGKLLVHGVAIFPGKPTIMGICPNSSGVRKTVFGIPGYPVSAVLAMTEFVKPILSYLTGTNVAVPVKVKATLGRKTASRLGMEEFLRVKMARVKGKMLAIPAKRGASVISSLVEADGIVRIPRNSEGLESGQELEIELLRPLEQIEKNILMVGSHDNALDLLTVELQRKFGLQLSISSVGSMAGLTALKNGGAHFSGAHLLDPSSGEYNWTYIRRYMPDTEVVVVNFVQREQGILVRSGNPKNVKVFSDLTLKKLSVVNRQSGAGTRVLFDHFIEKEKLKSSDFIGYDQVETTHIGVAMAISSGRADAGLGIRSAANLLGLDFIPLQNERFDFVFPVEFANSKIGTDLISVLRDQKFHANVSSLGGYNTELSGTVVEEFEK